VRESTRQTNKIEIYLQTVDLDVAGSNPVAHPNLSDSLREKLSQMNLGQT